MPSLARLLDSPAERWHADRARAQALRDFDAYLTGEAPLHLSQAPEHQLRRLGRRALSTHGISADVFRDPTLALLFLAAADTVARTPSLVSAVAPAHEAARLLRRMGEAYPVRPHLTMRHLLHDVARLAGAPTGATIHDFARWQRFAAVDAGEELRATLEASVLPPMRERLGLPAHAADDYDVLVLDVGLDRNRLDTSPAYRDHVARRDAYLRAHPADAARLAANEERWKQQIGPLPRWLALYVDIPQPTLILPFLTAALVTSPWARGAARHEYGHHLLRLGVPELGIGEWLDESMADAIAGTDFYPRSARVLAELPGLASGRLTELARKHVPVTDRGTFHRELAEQVGLPTYLILASLKPLDVSRTASAARTRAYLAAVEARKHPGAPPGGQYGAGTHHGR